MRTHKIIPHESDAARGRSTLLCRISITPWISEGLPMRLTSVDGSTALATVYLLCLLLVPWAQVCRFTSVIVPISVAGPQRGSLECIPRTRHSDSRVLTYSGHSSCPSHNFSWAPDRGGIPTIKNDSNGVTALTLSCRTSEYNLFYNALLGD